MEKIEFDINGIHAILYGRNTERVYLFIHGKSGFKEEAEAFAEIVCKREYQVLAVDLPEHGARKSESNFFVPWVVVPELKSIMDYSKGYWKDISLRANSIGAWFSLSAFRHEKFTRCLFVSPVLDMELLIKNMMQWASVTEEMLKEQKQISTNFGETLDWEYFQYAKTHPISEWNSPTAILYAEKDNLTDMNTIDAFVNQYGCRVTVMKNGEHWFHTQEQLKVLRAWEDTMSGLLSL